MILFDIYILKTFSLHKPRMASLRKQEHKKTSMHAAARLHKKATLVSMLRATTSNEVSCVCCGSRDPLCVFCGQAHAKDFAPEPAFVTETKDPAQTETDETWTTDGFVGYLEASNVCDEPCPAMQRCGDCFLACYCSTTCQDRDWKRHKRECRFVGNEIASLLSLPTTQCAISEDDFYDAVQRLFATRDF
jgi:hypothetical protein